MDQTVVIKIGAIRRSISPTPRPPEKKRSRSGRQPAILSGTWSFPSLRGAV